MKKIILSLIIIGNSIELMAQNNKIESTGNLGIGTTNPAANLEIYRFDGISHAGIFTN